MTQRELTQEERLARLAYLREFVRLLRLERDDVADDSPVWDPRTPALLRRQAD